MFNPETSDSGFSSLNETKQKKTWKIFHCLHSFHGYSVNKFIKLN